MASSSKSIGDKLSDVLHLKKLHEQGILSLAEFISMSSNINEGASTHREEEAGNSSSARSDGPSGGSSPLVCEDGNLFDEGSCASPSSVGARSEVVGAAERVSLPRGLLGGGA